MNIKYKILNINAAAGQFTAMYFDEELLPESEGYVYTYDIPIIDGKAASIEDLKELVRGLIPTHAFERLAALRKGIDTSHLEGLVGQVFEIPKQSPFVVSAGVVDESSDLGVQTITATEAL